MNYVEISKGYYAARYNGDIITGTIDEIQAYIRKQELTAWISHNRKSSTR